MRRSWSGIFSSMDISPMKKGHYLEDGLTICGPRTNQKHTQAYAHSHSHSHTSLAVASAVHSSFYASHGFKLHFTLYGVRICATVRANAIILFRQHLCAFGKQPTNSPNLETASNECVVWMVFHQWHYVWVWVWVYLCNMCGTFRHMGL